MSEHIYTSTTQANPALGASQASQNKQEKDCIEFPAYLPVQAKLSVGAPDDPLEHEANAMADRIMRMPEQNFIQRKCSHCEEEEKAQRKPLSSFIQRKESAGGTAATDAISNQVNSSKGNGTGMEEGTKSFMETRFGTDFSDVRIHTDNGAMQMNSALSAKAFTVGSDIYFNRGEYTPASQSGKHLLAHELTHTVQQTGEKIIRKTPAKLFGPAFTGAPVDWDTQVKAATDSTQKKDLIQKAVGTLVTIEDKTLISKSDKVPDQNHLVEYSASSKKINFDENLQSKSAVSGGRSLSINAGYTLHSGSKFFIILSAAALDPDNFYATTITLNHEFDHIAQYLSGSLLTSNDSELDAWTSTFIREFHRDYILGDTGSICFVKFINLYSPLSMYYKIVSDAKLKAGTEKRIKDYFDAIIKPDPAHLQVFQYWLYKSLNSKNNPDLAVQLNQNLSLNIKASAPIKSFRQFSCKGINKQSFPASPSLNQPIFSTGSGGASTGSPGAGTKRKKMDE